MIRLDEMVGYIMDITKDLGIVGVDKYHLFAVFFLGVCIGFRFCGLFVDD